MPPVRYLIETQAVGVLFLTEEEVYELQREVTSLASRLRHADPEYQRLRRRGLDMCEALRARLPGERTPE